MGSRTNSNSRERLGGAIMKRRERAPWTERQDACLVRLYRHHYKSFNTTKGGKPRKTIPAGLWSILATALNDAFPGRPPRTPKAIKQRVQGKLRGTLRFGFELPAAQRAKIETTGDERTDTHEDLPLFSEPVTVSPAELTETKDHKTAQRKESRMSEAPKRRTIDAGWELVSKHGKKMVRLPVDLTAEEIVHLADIAHEQCRTPDSMIRFIVRDYFHRLQRAQPFRPPAQTSPKSHPHPGTRGAPPNNHP